MEKMKIGNRYLGKRCPVFIVAEAGSNHNGNMERAKELIDIAARAKVDAVKFQSFTADNLTMPRRGEYIEDPDRQKAYNDRWYKILKKLELPREWHRELFDYATDKGLIFLSSCFDMEGADFLEELGVPAFKIASIDLTNIPLIRHVARKKKLLILSTGLGTLGEVEEAVEAVRKENNEEIILLHATSYYPAMVEDANLLAMKTMEEAFQVPVGYSDHTFGIFTSVAAAALGAIYIEKHFTMDRRLPGAQHRYAAEPDDLRWMVRGIRDVEKALGSSLKRPVEKEIMEKSYGRRSLVAKVNIPFGTEITPEMIALITPGGGISPKYVDIAIGRKTKVDIQAGDVITWDMI